MFRQVGLKSLLPNLQKNQTSMTKYDLGKPEMEPRLGTPSSLPLTLPSQTLQIRKAPTTGAYRAPRPRLRNVVASLS